MRKVMIGEHEIEIAEFHPCLVYNAGLDCLSVHLRDCSICEDRITRRFDALFDNHPNKRKSSYVGFNLHGVGRMLHDQGYKQSSISLENLIKRFDRHYPGQHIPIGLNLKIYDYHKKRALEVSREHQFVWWIKK